MSRISAPRIGRLIDGWRLGETRVSDELATGIARLIRHNELPVGGTLPSERTLSGALGISRGSIVAAYELLREAGLLESRRGSGWRIIASHSSGSGPVHARLLGELQVFPQDIDMTSGALQPSPILLDVLRDFEGGDLVTVATGLGYDAFGIPPLRRAIARYYSDLGLPTAAEDILVTSGAQQAVWLLANTLVEATDGVVVEDPTYRGSLEAFRRRNARLIPVAVRADGVDLDQLERALHTRPRLLYLFADSHNPTGRSFSKEQRRDLLDLLERYSTFLIEDGTQRELRVATNDLLPSHLVGRCDPERAATIGTLSKLFWGGLRIGWIRAAPSLIRRLAGFKAVDDLGSSIFDQNIAVRLLERIDDAKSYRQQELAASLDCADGILSEHAEEDWVWSRPAGGSAIWIRMPGVDTVALCEEASRHHLRLTAGCGYSAEENFRDCLRLPFVRPRQTMELVISSARQLAAEQRQKMSAAC